VITGSSPSAVEKEHTEHMIARILKAVQKITKVVKGLEPLLVHIFLLLAAAIKLANVLRGMMMEN
jgi:hypothetical protein